MLWFPGIDNLFVWTCTRLEEVTGQKWEPGLQATELSSAPIVVPPERTRYLSEIAEAFREFKREAKEELGEVKIAKGDEIPSIWTWVKEKLGFIDRTTWKEPNPRYGGQKEGIKAELN